MAQPCMESYLEKFTVQQPKITSKWCKSFVGIAWELGRGFVAILITASLPLLCTSLIPTKLLPPTHTASFSSVCFPTYLPSTFLLVLPFFPCRLTQFLELSSTSFIPLIILPIYHSPYPEFPSPKKQSGTQRSLLARGKLRGRRECCKHLPVSNFHSENEINK